MAITVYNDVKKIKIGDNVFNLYDSGGTVTSVGITDGEGLTSSGGPVTSSGDITLSLDAATSSTLGGIKVGYGASGKNYAIALDSSNNAYVNVPWTDTNTKVNQYYTTTSSAYPLLFSYKDGVSSEGNRGAQYARLVNSIYAVPSTGTVYTNSFRSLDTIAAERGVFNKLIATSASIGDLDVNNLTAQNATVVGLLDVKGELHTNQWTNANIANIGGSFYISPTIEDFDSGWPLISISYDSSSAAPLEMAISGKFATDFVKSGQSATGVNWPVGSLILVTGDIEVNDMTYPLGTLKGTLKSPVTATNQQTSKTITLDNLKDAQNNSNPSVLQELYEANNHSSISNATFKNGKISLYEIEGYRIGILLSSMGDDSNSIIDIYGGVSSEPQVRIGHLGAVPSWTDSAGITHKPTGWGIYTNNGYFTGTVIADAGVIGGWIASSSALYKGAFASNGSVWLAPNGYNSSSVIGGSPASTHFWAVTASNKFGVTTGGDLFASSATISGKITASEGRIGGWKIGTDYLSADRLDQAGNVRSTDFIYLSNGQASSSEQEREIVDITASDWVIAIGGIPDDSSSSSSSVPPGTFGIRSDGSTYVNNFNVKSGTFGAVDSIMTIPNALSLDDTGFYAISSDAAPTSEKFYVGFKSNGLVVGPNSTIQLQSSGEGNIGREDVGDYLSYTINNFIGTINLKTTSINSNSGIFTNLVTNSFIAESIGLNGEDLATRLNNLGTGITAVQANVNSLSANLTTNYYTKAEIDTKQADINNTITQNIGTINQSINQINTTISTMNDTFGVNTEFYFAKSSVKKWALRLGREVTTGKPNLNDIWIG